MTRTRVIESDDAAEAATVAATTNPQAAVTIRRTASTTWAGDRRTALIEANAPLPAVSAPEVYAAPLPGPIPSVDATGMVGKRGKSDTETTIRVASTGSVRQRASAEESYTLKCSTTGMPSKCGPMSSRHWTNSSPPRNPSR